MTEPVMHQVQIGDVCIDAARTRFYKPNSKSHTPIMMGASRRAVMKAKRVPSQSKMFSQLKSPNSIKIGDFNKKTIAICALES